MPATNVLFFCDDDGQSPVVKWLWSLRKDDSVGFLNCLSRLEMLEASGHELRRPAADYLRDGIYELRAKHKNVQYRLLYFFHGRNVAVISHAMVKRGSAVPNIDIQRAIERKLRFEKNSARHIYKGEV